MKCVNWKPLARGSLVGFADLQMDSGLVLLGCTLHAANGRRWVNPPSRPMLDADRKPIVEGGKVQYSAVVDFTDKKIRYRWSDEAVKAIEAAFPECKAPAEAGAMSGTDDAPTQRPNQAARNGF